MAMTNCTTRTERPPSRSRAASAGMKLPTAKTAVANSSSQGTSPAKARSGVVSNRTAPTTPPTRLTTEKAVTLTSVTPRISLR